MTRQEFFEKYIGPFTDGFGFIFDEKKGFIVWRVGTGNNVEILHLRAFQLRKGYATWLMKQMAERLKDNPPYHSVFVFTRGSNKPARAAYEAFGFRLVEVPNLYQSDETLIGTITFTDLLNNLGVE